MGQMKLEDDSKFIESATQLFSPGTLRFICSVGLPWILTLLHGHPRTGPTSLPFPGVAGFVRLLTPAPVALVIVDVAAALAAMKRTGEANPAGVSTVELSFSDSGSEKLNVFAANCPSSVEIDWAANTTVIKLEAEGDVAWIPYGPSVIAIALEGDASLYWWPCLLDAKIEGAEHVKQQLLQFLESSKGSLAPWSTLGNDIREWMAAALIA